MSLFPGAERYGTRSEICAGCTCTAYAVAEHPLGVRDGDRAQQVPQRFRRGAAVRTAPRQRADTPLVPRPPTPATFAQPPVGPPAEDRCRPAPSIPGVDVKPPPRPASLPGDRKSTRLNSSHVEISYAV